MALIKCPDCGGKVSTQAKACPACACPIGSNAENSVQTIQGRSKKYKNYIIFSSLLIICSMGYMIIGFLSKDPSEFYMGTAGLFFFFGSLWYLYARMAAWYDHS